MILNELVVICLNLTKVIVKSCPVMSKKLQCKKCLSRQCLIKLNKNKLKVIKQGQGHESKKKKM